MLKLEQGANSSGKEPEKQTEGQAVTCARSDKRGAEAEVETQHFLSSTSELRYSSPKIILRCHSMKKSVSY